MKKDGAKVELSKEAKDEALEKIREMISCLDFVRELIKEDNLVADNVKTCMGVNEHIHAELSKLLGYDSIIAAEIENRFAEIRTANKRICELEQCLGKEVSPGAVSGALNLYEKILRGWYSSEGFNYASIDLFPWCIELTFSSDMVYQEECRHNNDEVYCAMWKEDAGTARKIAAGWDIHEDQFSAELLDTDNNKKQFEALIRATFPNARIESFDAYRNDYGTFSLRPKVSIPFEDVDAAYKRAAIDKEDNAHACI